MQWNRSFVFCFLLFCGAVFLSAQETKPLAIPGCSKVISLKGGELMLTGPVAGEFLSVNVSSFLTAPGNIITNVSGNDPANTGIGSQCNEITAGCTPSQIESFIQSGFGIIEFPPNGVMFVNGRRFGMWGGPGLLATSFTSSLDADGNLVISGDAVGYGMLNECDLSGECMPVPNNVCFDFGKTSWHYSGLFIRDVGENSQGGYDFSFIEIKSKHPVNTLASGTN